MTVVLTKAVLMFPEILAFRLSSSGNLYIKRFTMEDRGAKRRRTGGVRQRISKSSAGGEIQLESFLDTYLVTMFAWGEFSPQRVQHLARLVVDDFERTQQEPRIMNDLRALAASGFWCQPTRLSSGSYEKV